MTERPSAAELWPVLPADVREKLLAYGHKYWSQVYEDVALQNQNWIPLRSPVGTHAGYAELNRITQRVSQLVLDACRRRARTAGELRAVLGVPDGRIQLLDDDEPLTGRLINAIRSDLLLERGVPRMVECNVESALGGVLDADGVIKRWMEVYRDEPMFTAMDAAAPPSAVDARFDAIRSDVGPDQVTAMVYTSGGGYPGAHDATYMINRLRPFADRGRELGVDLIVHPVEWLEQDADGRLKAGDRILDAVWRMFVPTFVDESDGMAALRAANAARNFRMYLPTAVWLLSNKTIFAWLWDDLDQLPAEDAEIVRAHVPRTWVYQPALRQRVIDERERLVFKPTDDYGGHGVFIGPQTSPEDWAAAIDAATGPHIFQELIEADPLTMQFLKPETGEVVEADVSYCVSTYLFDRIPAGVFTRFSPPGAGGVVNLTQGALTGGLLLVNVGENR
ncbi:hypothetical protein [Kribbella sp. CA-293567]|uniref:hypothetical protein n=1 Tax=Kribbella sp. CA-293567 TaxID=3002436 RepID=UPI0022DD57C1|nr:hypothetical protein [Kribbella sp. CA-293567]WBQ06430.1 hypothetical protein OX958_06475 [Kribbella sp. CA-293567]